MEWTATQHVGWWGGVGWGGVGWGGWGMMSTFLELAYMVDATQHDGVGWGGECC